VGVSNLMNTSTGATWRRATLAATLAGCAALAASAGAAADTAPIQVVNGSLPWTDPSHQSPLENLAGQIATRIANRPVSVRCEGATDWQTLATQRGFDPRYELGYVGSYWPTLGGIPNGAPTISGFTELSPDVCLPLQNFAIATSKPTKCTQTVTQTTTELTTESVQEKRKVRVRVKVRGKKVWRTVTKTVTVKKQVPTQVQHQVTGPLAPCFADNAMLPMSDSTFWSTYQAYAYAIFALAHESIHLGGAVGGRLASGYLVGDQQAEAHANCYGLQWIPWLATQLGDTPDDAATLAQYAYTIIYPSYRGTAYWSTDCVPGGAMDIRSDKSGQWP